MEINKEMFEWVKSVLEQHYEEKLELELRLHKIEHEHEKYQSDDINKLTEALVAASKEIEPIVPNRENPHYKSFYADYGVMTATIKPILSKHGIDLDNLTYRDKDGRTFLVTRLLHVSGQWKKTKIQIEVDSPAGLKTELKYQNMGKAMTYALRLNLRNILALSIIGDPLDDDGNFQVPDAENRPNPTLEQRKKGSGIITPAQLKRVKEELADAPDLVPKILKSYGIDILADIPYDEYDRVMAAIEKNKKAIKKD